MSTVDGKRNEIQWLRAIAATEVVVCHSDLIVKTFSDVEIRLVWWYQPLASVGVELFFVLSGYIMCMRVPVTKTWVSFIKSRLARICPLYWLLTTVVILVGVAFPFWRLGAFTLNGATIARSFLMLPEWGFPILSVGWTLEYEMVFYLLVTGLMALGIRRGSGMVVFAWCLAVLGCIGCIVGPRTEGSAFWFHVASPYMFAFGAGWLIRALEQAKWLGRILGFGVFTAIGAVSLLLGSEWGDMLVLRIAFACAVFISFIAAPAIFQADNTVNRFAWLVGDASYSLYLSHWFVLSASGKVLGKLGLAPELGSIVRIAGILASISVGIAMYYYIEKPLGRLLRRDALSVGQPAVAR